MRPYRIDIPQAKLDRIARRVADAEIGYAPADDADWKYGADARYLAEFRDYWRDRYDWRAQEAQLNAYPQFMAEIEGVPIHFYHLRAEGGGYPLILTHGWPGSVVEFQRAMPRLAARGYDLVVPSLPGYGFSGRPASPIGPSDVARMWRTLMTEVLGYSRFGAQGGDWGGPVSRALGGEHPDVVGAVHVNMLSHRRRKDAPPIPGLDEWFAAMGKRANEESGYVAIQRSKPQTIGLALADSPIGYAGWVLEKCRSWSDCGGDLESRFGKDELITNIMSYVATDNVQSGIWLYYSTNFMKPGPRVEVPTGFAEFPAEAPPPPRAAVDLDYNIVHWTKMQAGGHFAAWEEPEAFADEVASFFETWR